MESWDDDLVSISACACMQAIKLAHKQLDNSGSDPVCRTLQRWMPWKHSTHRSHCSAQPQYASRGSHWHSNQPTGLELCIVYISRPGQTMLHSSRLLAIMPCSSKAMADYGRMVLVVRPLAVSAAGPLQSGLHHRLQPWPHRAPTVRCTTTALPSSRQW